MLGKNNSALWHKGKLISKRRSLYIGHFHPVRLFAEVYDAQVRNFPVVGRSGQSRG